MDLIQKIYHNKAIRDQLITSLTSPPFDPTSWEPAYFGYSQNHDLYVIATFVSMNNEDSAGFWAFSLDKNDQITIKHIYFGNGEEIYWDALSIAKLKYPDLKDIVLD